MKNGHQPAFPIVEQYDDTATGLTKREWVETHLFAGRTFIDKDTIKAVSQLADYILDPGRVERVSVLEKTLKSSRDRLSKLHLENQELAAERDAIIADMQQVLEKKL